LWQVFSEEGLSAGNIQFSQIEKQVRREEFDPLSQGQILHMGRNLPDVAHDAFCNAMMRDLKA
jgi:hypothetical protein